MSAQPNVPTCPFCGSYDVERLKGKVVWECHDTECNQTFMDPDYRFPKQTERQR